MSDSHQSEVQITYITWIRSVLQVVPYDMNLRRKGVRITFIFLMVHAYKNMYREALKLCLLHNVLSTHHLSKHKDRFMDARENHFVCGKFQGGFFCAW